MNEFPFDTSYVDKDDINLFQDGFYLQSLSLSRGDKNWSKILIAKTESRLDAIKFCKKEAAELIASALKFHNNDIWNVVITAPK